jgi:hypothetical protein
MLYVKSHPSGATVVIGGLERGKTPVLVKGLPAGETNIELSIEGAKPVTVRETVEANKVTTVSADIDVPGASITVISDPLEAAVYLDRTGHGKTPITIDGLPPGEHALLLLKAGFPRTTKTIFLTAGEARVLEIKLGAEEEEDEKAKAAAKPAAEPTSRVPEAMREFFEKFLALVERGDHAGAGKLAERASAEKSLGGFKAHVLAAARVAKALEDRRDAIRRGVEKLTGKEVMFRTKAGPREGTVQRVTEKGITLITEIRMGGRVAGKTTFTVAWKDLTRTEEVKLAKAWGRESKDAQAALAFLALARRDLAAAGRAADAAGDHILASHVRARVDALRPPPAEEAEPLTTERPALDLAQGLVGWWKLDEQAGSIAYDSSKRQNHATINGASRVRGWIGAALRFDGAKNYATAPAIGIPASEDAQTIAFFILIAARLSPEAAGVVSLVDGARGCGFTCGVRGGRLGVWRFGGRWLTSTAIPVAGTWHHYAYTRDGTQHALYIDGRKVHSSTEAASSGPAAAVQIGRAWRHGQYAQCTIDDIRIYSRAVSDEEVRELATGGTSKRK